MRSLLLFLVLLFALPVAGTAQTPDSTYARAGLERLVRGLAADGTLPDSLRQLRVADLTDKRLMETLPRLDDAGVVRFMHLLARSMHQLPQALCGSFLSGGSAPGPEPSDLLPWLPQPVVDEWLALYETLVRATTRPLQGKAAGPDEVRTWNQGLPTRLPPTSRDRLIRIAQTPPPSEADACWAMQTIMDDLAAAPVDTQAPIIRTMFGQ
jgi:hypothetical protein